MQQRREVRDDDRRIGRRGECAAQRLPPTIVDLSSADGATVEVRVGGAVDMTTDATVTDWTATVTDPAVVTFTPCCVDGSATFEIVAPPEPCTPTPTVEDLLVLYLADADEVEELAGRLRSDGRQETPADGPHLNPYWPRAGAQVFCDPDGYRLVLVTAGS